VSSEILYQALVVRRGAGGGFWGTPFHCEKPIPVMLQHGDAVSLCEFIGFPRMAVVRYEIDVDTRRKVAVSDVVLDVLGVPANTDPRKFQPLGRTDHKGLRYWAHPGVSSSIVFPNLKEAP